jgi:putative peptidoglycan lipid II flippase
VGEGGVAVLYFSYRLIQFPIGIFTNALSQAILPTMSAQALEDNHGTLEGTLVFGLRATLFVMLPASIGFMVLSRPLVSALFGGGRFDAYSTNMTANALFFYSLGLCAYGATKILQSCFFALKDTLTPTKVSALTLGLNIGLNTILMFPLKVCGLALATSLSGIITFFILFLLLIKKLKVSDIKPIVFSFLRMLTASLFMGAVCYFVSKNNFFLNAGNLNRLLNLSLAIIAGIISYMVFCFIFRVVEIRELWQWLVERRKG